MFINTDLRFPTSVLLLERRINNFLMKFLFCKVCVASIQFLWVLSGSNYLYSYSIFFIIRSQLMCSTLILRDRLHLVIFEFFPRIFSLSLQRRNFEQNTKETLPQKGGCLIHMEGLNGQNIVILKIGFHINV